MANWAQSISDDSGTTAGPRRCGRVRRSVHTMTAQLLSAFDNSCNTGDRLSALTNKRIASLAGAASATRGDLIQELWSGYGELVRYTLVGAEWPSVIVKHVTPGAGSGRSHDRKLRSYDVEQTWYRDWSARCNSACRVARCIHVERHKGEWLFLLEDLDEAGFDRRLSSPRGHVLDSCLRWLAAFHATFMGERARGLWKVGTYWHLKTRPDEHRSMARGPLRDAAAAIDERLSKARFLTIVHGDAKPANFCFSRDGRKVAAVDFQYVGGGCGMKDVAYLLAGESQSTVKRGLDVYFKVIRKSLDSTRHNADAIETEWRELYPWAWADLQRFLTGWAPGWRFRPHELAYTTQVIGLATH